MLFSWRINEITLSIHFLEVTVLKEKSASAVSIIGGADGPTSVFLAGNTGKRPLKIRIRNFLYKCKRKQVAKRIVPGAHSLEEVITYAKTKYSAIEIDTTQHKYIEQRKSLKESLIITHKPDLLGDMKDIPKPTDYTEESVREFYNQLESRRKMISQIPDEEMPMDFHIYEITIDDGHMEIEIDYKWNIFGVSYSGSKTVMKELRKIACDLYLYYGITKEDIENNTNRYSALLTTLCT